MKNNPSPSINLVEHYQTVPEVLKFRNPINALSNRLSFLHRVARKAALGALKETGRALIVLPTGTGKTRLGAQIAKKILQTIPKGKKVIWVTHKLDLKTDALDELSARLSGYKVGVFDGNDSLLNHDVVVATILTISKENHLSEIDEQSVGAIIVDEGHHAAAASYQRFLQRFPKAWWVALTATHIRPDGSSIVESEKDDGEKEILFGEPVIYMSIAEAILKKIYADPQEKSFCVLTDSIISGIVHEDGEYTQAQLDRCISSKKRDEIILASYKKYVRSGLHKEGRTPKGIGFCVNRKHARRMYRKAKKAGIKSAYVVGSASGSMGMSLTERERILETFKKTNNIEILWVVDLLNEGSNFPDVNFLLMCRPTRSNTIYTQQLGRGARYLDSIEARKFGLTKAKKDFYVVDYVDNTTKGFASYIRSNVCGKAYQKEQIIADYSGQDPIRRAERVNALSNILGFERGSIEYYPTKEEAYEACLRLGITSTKLYKKNRPNDRRLPAAPFDYYSGWSFSHLGGRKAPGSFTKEQCFSEAMKYKTLNEWRIKHQGSYQLANKYGWVKELRIVVFPDAPKHNYWTPERCIEDAKKYKNINSWGNHSSGAYQIARRNGWMEEIRATAFPHLKQQVKWTKAMCLKEARRHTRLSDWQKLDMNSYSAALRNGWMPSIRKMYFPNAKPGRPKNKSV